MMEFYAGTSPRLFLDESSVFDIGSLVVDGVDLSPGRAIPDDGDPRIDHSLEGFLFTCGPDHIRHPEEVEAITGRKYPLHGSFSANPATVTEFDIGNRASLARATVEVALANGGHARLEREWRVDGESGEVRLADRVINDGDTPFSPMLMYHMNLGARHFDGNVGLSGDMFTPNPMNWMFGTGNNNVFCVPVGEGVAEMRLGPLPAIGGKSLRVSFGADTLPFLQMWRNQERPAHVLGIEPASHDWKSRHDLALAGALLSLPPGQDRRYTLSFAFGRDFR